MNIQGDRTQPGSLVGVRLGRRGRGARHLPHHQERRSSSTTRPRASRPPGSTGGTRSRGSRRARTAARTAQSWADVQFQRMPNVSLLPGEKDQSWDDLIAATDRGIAIIGDGSFSIDQQRYNAQFGGQLFYEIKGGKIVGMLKDVAYQMRTPDFWNSMDMIGGQKSYFLGGAFNDGKGQPSQSNAVSHGCVPCALPATSTSSTPGGRRELMTPRSLFDPAGLALAGGSRGDRQAHAGASPRPTRRASRINSGARGNTRFAVNQISTGGDNTDTVVTIRSAFGKRAASAVTNKLDDASLAGGRGAVRAPREARAGRSRGDARARPADVSGVAGGTTRSRPNLDPAGRAAAVRAVTEPSRAAGLVADRVHRVRCVGAIAIANNKGCSPTRARPARTMTTTVRTPDGTRLAAGPAATHTTWSQHRSRSALGGAGDREGAARRPILWRSSRGAIPSSSSPPRSAISCS